MQTVTFTCAHCNNLMAVGTDLLGQQVQCPTCGNVVVAPATAAGPQPVVTVSMDSSSQAFEVSLDSPVPKEAHESIFSEEVHDEDVFGTRPPKVEMPNEGPVMPAVPSTNGSAVTGFANYPPPGTELGQKSNDLDATIVMPGVQPDVSPEASPTSTRSAELPVPPPAAASQFAAPVPPSAIVPSAQENWLADQPAPRSDPASGEFPDVEADAAAADQFGQPQEGSRRRAQAGLLTTILVPYAILITIVAVYYMWRYHSSPPESNALETMPDVIRLLDKPISPKNAGTTALPAPDTPLAKRMMVKLNQSIRVGELEVTPLRVTRGKFEFYAITKEDQRMGPRITGDEALTLHLKIKNLSSKLMIVPTDPMYDRQFNPEHSTAKPYMLIDVGGQKFFGGPFDLNNLEGAKRVYASGQDYDDTPLGPGEERTTVTCSNPKNEKVLSAVTGAKGKIVWRVHLRKGQIPFRGRDIPVTTVIGVEFTAADVQKVARR